MLSPAAAASLVCMSRQPPQPLIWLARIFTSSCTAFGNAESVMTLFDEMMCLAHFDPTSLRMGLIRVSISISFVFGCLHHHDEAPRQDVTTPCDGRALLGSRGQTQGVEALAVAHGQELDDPAVDHGAGHHAEHLAFRAPGHEPGLTVDKDREYRGHRPDAAQNRTGHLGRPDRGHHATRMVCAPGHLRIEQPYEPFEVPVPCRGKKSVDHVAPAPRLLLRQRHAL